MSQDSYRAEVFDALSHPTRIGILKVLREGPLSFADLKKWMNIESSGHLQHHLSKLGDLIKTDEHGKYLLSDQGKDALFVMQIVEKAESGEKIRIYPKKFKRRGLLGVIAIFIIISSLTSSIYLANLGLLQSQYVYDVATGSPLKDDANMRMISSYFEIPVGRTYNFTAMVYSTLSPPNIFDEGDDFGTLVSPPPIVTDTYYRIGIVGFRINLTAVTEQITDDVKFKVYFGSVIGPNSSEAQEIADPYEAPPYRTRLPKTFTYSALSGSQVAEEYYIPITTFGNYTFHITNVGNITVRARRELWASTVTMETKPLRGNENFSALPSHEKIVRIRWRPTSLDLVAMVFAVGTPVALAAVSIFLMGRRFSSQHPNHGFI